MHKMKYVSGSQLLSYYVQICSGVGWGEQTAMLELIKDPLPLVPSLAAISEGR